MTFVLRPFNIEEEQNFFDPAHDTLFLHIDGIRRTILTTDQDNAEATIKISHDQVSVPFESGVLEWTNQRNERLVLIVTHENVMYWIQYIMHIQVPCFYAVRE